MTEERKEVRISPLFSDDVSHEIEGKSWEKMCLYLSAEIPAVRNRERSATTNYRMRQALLQVPA